MYRWRFERTPSLLTACLIQFGTKTSCCCIWVMILTHFTVYPSTCGGLSWVLQAGIVSTWKEVPSKTPTKNYHDESSHKGCSDARYPNQHIHTHSPLLFWLQEEAVHKVPSVKEPYVFRKLRRKEENEVHSRASAINSTHAPITPAQLEFIPLDTSTGKLFSHFQLFTWVHSLCPFLWQSLNSLHYEHKEPTTKLKFIIIVWINMSKQYHIFCIFLSHWNVYYLPFLPKMYVFCV